MTHLELIAALAEHAKELLGENDGKIGYILIAGDAGHPMQLQSNLPSLARVHACLTSFPLSFLNEHANQEEAILMAQSATKQ